MKLLKVKIKAMPDDSFNVCKLNARGNYNMKGGGKTD